MTSQTTNTLQQRTGKTLTHLLLVTLMSGSSAWAGQAVTGKIIIDGVVYGEGNDNVVKGSGTIVKEQRKVSDFNSIASNIAANVNYQRSNTVSVVISGDDNILPFITTTVSAGQLVISSTKSFQPTQPLLVEVSGPHLKAFSLDGSGNVSLTGIDEAELLLELNGSSTTVAQGKAERLSIAIGGSSEVDTKNLVSQTADVNITGAGTIALTATESLKAMITGSGDIKYYGHPKSIDKQIVGSGDIESGD